MLVVLSGNLELSCVLLIVPNRENKIGVRMSVLKLLVPAMKKMMLENLGFGASVKCDG